MKKGEVKKIGGVRVYVPFEKDAGRAGFVGCRPTIYRDKTKYSKASRRANRVVW